MSRSTINTGISLRAGDVAFLDARAKDAGSRSRVLQDLIRDARARDLAEHLRRVRELTHNIGLRAQIIARSDAPPDVLVNARDIAADVAMIGKILDAVD